jgi:hypothetical protein
MLANGSILSEIFFFFFYTVTVFIKHNNTTLWKLYFSALFVFNINDDAKIRFVLVKSETNCYDFICQLPFLLTMSSSIKKTHLEIKIIFLIFSQQLWEEQFHVELCGEEDPVALLLQECQQLLVNTW